jgi:class 3 adenylate cyclase/tetratricopeptide (TPR) repeat protein
MVAAVEQLARDAHEAWVRQRTAEGWRHAPLRDEIAKGHPCLVPYEILPELEKEYVRNAVLETLHGILLLGYRLEDSSYHPHLSPSVPAEEEPIRLPDDLDSFVDRDLASLLDLWRGRNVERWAREPELYRSLGQRILRLGEPLLAYDVIVEGLGYFPGDVRLRQLLASALSYSGSTRRANAILVQLMEEGYHDEETLSMLARTHKDLWSRAAGREERERHLQRAFELYTSAYRLTGGYYPGINAATTALLAGRHELACALAREVRERCLHELRKEGEGNDGYWPTATLAEAALILGEWAEAGRWYRRAADLGRGQYGQLGSTRRNAGLILDYLEVGHQQFDLYFRIPRVVMFAGHMIDRPGRSSPRFPAELEQAVADAIGRRLDEIGECIGYTSAACGADILFLEALFERGREAHIVLPFDREKFREVSVELAPGSWGERFERALQQATEVITASEQKMSGSGMPFDYANRLLHGLASMRAEQLHSDLVGLAVWDGKPGDGLGGTTTVVEQWHRAGRRVELIDLSEIVRSAATQTDGESDATDLTEDADPRSRASTFPSEIIAILFADAVGFSKLTEEELTLFVQHFLGAIGRLAESSAHAPVTKNTWGDGLYLVFRDVRDAGLFALELYDGICKADWSACGLPPNLNLRIALHAGPAYSCTDPITGKPNYMGSHVSHASRIEPVTPPGQIYASQGFAALATAERIREFTCEYVGRMTLAKGHGIFPTYLLRRRVDG